MSSIGWKINRLRRMGVGEIAYRVANVLRGSIETLGYGLVVRPPAPAGRSADPWLAHLPTAFSETTDKYIARADAILRGEFRVFAMDEAKLGFPLDWNTDPRTQIKAPLSHGKTLNYRNPAVVGNIKYLWEPNRHLELVWLAQAWHLSRDPRYLDGAKTLLDSWFEQCPYPLGVNWTSALEISIRLLNWSFAWHLLQGEKSALFTGAEGMAFRARWLDSVYQHCFFISKHFSRFSSANNHLFGEYMGLFAASVTWPLWRESEGWRELAKQGLEIEALIQNTEDGVNKEQAIWYHHEVADMMLLCALLGAPNGVDFSAPYWARLEAMLEYLASVMDVAGNMPMIGDSDDAVMTGLGIEPDVYRSLLATGAVLFGRGDFKAKATRFDDKSRWLLGDEAAVRFSALAIGGETHLPRRSFPGAGYYILGKNLDSDDEIRLVADAGSLGFLSIAAHGHADALAFTLSVRGKQILVDPGTYSYQAGQWRDYFRGTAAHNTVRVDLQDQSLAGGNFLWLRHAQAKCLDFKMSDERDLWLAEHDGYHRLEDPVTHKRSICLNKPKNEIQVTDTLTCRGEHTVELHWHLGEHCVVKVVGSTVSIHNGAITTTLGMPDSGWKPEIVCGSEGKPLGWVSRHYDQKTPISTIRWAGKISGTTSLNTAITIRLG